MKPGDRVKHKIKGWFGTVLEISTRGPGVMVDLSDEKGIMVRIIHFNNLEVVNVTK